MTLLDSQPSFTCPQSAYRAVLPSESMPTAGVPMTLTLSATNFLGYSASASAVAVKSNLPQPMLSIQVRRLLPALSEHRPLCGRVFIGALIPLATFRLA